MPRRRVVPAPYTGSYRPAFVCFTCRKVFKRLTPAFRRGGWEVWNFDTWHVTCPQCGAPMHYPGPAFKAPPRADATAWAVAEGLIRGGFRFRHYGVSAFTDNPLPRHPRDVPRFLDRWHAARRTSGGQGGAT